jgi:DNA primase
VKQANDLASLIQSKGVRLSRKGKQWVGLCPFHNDHEPSLIVDPRKQLWNCLGACREGGDVYKFVMKSEGLDFRQAHLRLGGQERPWPESETSTPAPKKQACAKAKTTGGEERKVSATEPAQPPQSGPLPSAIDHRQSAIEEAWLERAAEHYAKRLMETPEAQQYLASRGLGSAELIAAFRLGYSDGSLPEKLPPEGREALQLAGMLTGRGQELMKGCVVVPLVDLCSLRVVSLYGRHILATSPARGSADSRTSICRASGVAFSIRREPGTLRKSFSPRASSTRQRCGRLGFATGVRSMGSAA